MPEVLVHDFGGVNVEGPDPATWALAEGLDFYVGHAPGRNDLHIDSDREWYAALWQEYWDERDPAGLLREPCLSEPKSLEVLDARLQRSASARDNQHGLGLSLGDEISLTPWGAPFDLCGSVACRERYQGFVRAHEPWKTLFADVEGAAPFPDTDSTRLAWVDGDARHVRAWLARRDFHHDVLIETLAHLAQSAREASPGTPVGLFGQSGRTAFGDVGVEQVLPLLDFLEVYRLRDSRELLYTLRRPEQRSYLTVFPDENAPDGPAWIAWEHWLRGGDGLVLWSDRELLAQPDYRKRMARAVNDLRGLRTRFGSWAPRPKGAALIHSPDALALSWLRDALHDGPTWMRRFASYQSEHGTREELLRGMLRLLEDCGNLPGSVPLDTIDGHIAQRFPLLVAPQLLIVDDAEERRLRAHLAAGGQLLVCGDFATYTRAGERREGSLLADLQGTFGERVRRFELDGARYILDRQALPRPYVEERRGALAALLPKGSAPTWRVASEPNETLWLRAQQYDSQTGTWICAAMPNAQEPGQRSALQAMNVSIEGLEGLQLEWVHPPPLEGQAADEPRLLKPGDALVFLLRQP